MTASQSKKPPVIGIVAVPESSGAVLYGLFEVLSSFGAAWAEVMGGPQNPVEFDVRIVAPSRDPFTCVGGVPITPHASLDEIDYADVVIVTDLAINPDTSHDHKWPQVKSWLKRIYNAGGTVCSVCSGSVLLAGSGLLDDKPATTHWAYVAHFKRFYPQVKLEAGRVLVPVDEEKRIVTCGGMAAWEDLVLYLIASYYGEGMAVNAAKLYLFGDRSEGQLLFAAMSKPKRHEDAVIANSQQWLAEHYDAPNPVMGMVQQSGLAERTFKRRFKAATGYTPIDYVQTLRVEEAKHLLEATDAAIDLIAHQTGYEDPTSFRRLFKRLTGVTPGRYRQRFQSLRGGRSC
ncbi:GlxA family transcriptional regulator [Sedimenticola sp.]|uniref:GlxA family transcriptional regulator n=1 Tax=Sedimenticola sp. TaxID=1940285 RepID=UPI003D127F08